MTNSTLASAKEPAHLRTYRGIRDLILSGDLVPGEPVTIQGLTERLDAGMTPVREAIRRLTSEGALVFHGNRRVTVPSLTLAEMDELIYARLSLEPELARRGALNAPDGLADQMLAIDKEIDEAMERGDVRGYMVHNHRFHMTLYTAAQSDIIGPMVDALWLRSGPASRIMCTRYGTLNLPDMHDSAMEALRNGDADGVADAIKQDIMQGMQNVRAMIADGEKGA